MIGANKKRQFTKTALAALLGAGMSSIAMSSATAGGDIGGNCCADLEERVAELEATTVRKGNRKVSLRLSGQVNKMIMYWDDGHVNDAFVVDNIYSASRFKMDGSAKIRPGWSAGYLVEMEFDDAESTVVNNSGNDDGGGTNGLLDLRHSYWWLKSDRYGTLKVGQTGHATYLITWMDTSGTGIISRDSKHLVGFSLQWRNSATNALSGTLFGNTHTSLWEGRGDVVRYDSPTIGGFKLSAAWGEDDVGDVALRFGRKLGNFKVVAGIGYADSTDTANEYETVSGSFGAFHIPTGLNIHFAAGDRDVTGSALDRTYWYVKGGLKRKYNSWGATAISVDYYSGDELTAAGGDSTQVGVQLVQSIDAAAMDLYLGYSHSEYDDATAVVYDDIDMFMAGGIIKF